MGKGAGDPNAPASFESIASQLGIDGSMSKIVSFNFDNLSHVLQVCIYSWLCQVFCGLLSQSKRRFSSVGYYCSTRKGAGFLSFHQPED